MDEGLDVPKTAVATVLQADVSNAEELNFDETDVTAFLKNKNYNVYMCVRIT